MELGVAGQFKSIYIILAATVANFKGPILDDSNVTEKARRQSQNKADCYGSCRLESHTKETVNSGDILKVRRRYG